MLKKLNSPKINEPVKKWATELNRSFSKEEVKMDRKHMKNAHHSWTFRKCKSKPN
jgi:hypothetical protein